MENLKPNSQRAQNTIILMWIVLILEIASLISAYFQYDLLQTVTNGGNITTETANANDMRERTIAIISMIVYIITSISFIQWFRRAYYNLHQKVTYLFQSEGWAAGCWFVPIVNLYRPYQIMKELYQETKKLLEKEGLNVSSNTTSITLGLWWTLWITNNIIGQFIFRYSLKAETINELTVSTVASMIGNIVGIPLALITIKIIKDYSNIELLLEEITNVKETTNESI